MSIDLLSFRDAIVDWVATVLPGVNVAWRNQSIHQPQHPYVSLWILKVRGDGRTIRDADYDATRPVGQEMRRTYAGKRELLLDVNVYTRQKLPPEDAISLGEKLAGSLQGLQTKAALLRKGVVFTRQNFASDMSQLESDEHVQRYSIDLTFEIDSLHEEFTGYIETVIVRGTVDVGDGTETSIEQTIDVSTD